jgi:hypothetical protein
VTRDLDKQRKAYEASTIGKLANLGTQFNKLVGGEGSESEPESDVRLVWFRGLRCVRASSCAHCGAIVLLGGCGFLPSWVVCCGPVDIMSRR